MGSGIIGFRGDNLTAMTDADPQLILADDTPGVLDVNANQTNPNTFATGGVAEFDLADDVVALSGSGTADAPYLLISVITTNLTNIRVQYNLRDLETGADNAAQQVALQYRIGNTGVFTNVPAAYIADATNNNTMAGLVTPIDVILPANANNQAVVQLRIMTTNATGNDEWVGIDDITISGTAPCNISAVTFANASACNDNGTNTNPSDDYFTADVTVTFSNPPATGDLQFEPNGDALAGGGALSVPVAGLTSPYTFTGVRFKADNSETVVELEFTAQPTTCVRTATGPTVNSCSSAICDISAVTFGNVGACNDNGTNTNPLDDYYTADVTVTFSNPPATGSLQFEPNGDALAGGGALSVPVAGLTSPYTFTGVRFKADNSLTVVELEFTAQPTTCVRTAFGPTVGPCSVPPTCGISNITFSNVGACNSNGTESNATDDFFTANITVTFTIPPASGTLDLTGDVLAGGGPLSASAPFTSPITFTGVRLRADGTASAVTATFSANTACTFSVANGPTVSSCSACVPDATPPSITCPGPVTVSCAGQVPTPVTTGTGAPTATDVCSTPSVAFVNDVTTPGTCTNRFTVTRTYRATDGAGLTAQCQQTITVNDITGPVFDQSPLPANLTLSCIDPLPMPAILTGTDGCGGSGSIPNAIWINEFHYDNVGIDTGEFVEVAGTAGLNLSNYQIVLYNGNGGVVYNTLNLTGVIDNEGNSGFGAVAFTFTPPDVQNGAPDGMALVQISNGMVLQLISYEGSFQAMAGPANGMVLPDIGVSETGTTPVGASLHLTGTGSTAAAFTWGVTTDDSPGDLNTGQIITSLPVSIPAVFSQTETPGPCAGSRVVTYQWTLTDVCTNQTVHSQIITVTDNIPPVLTPAPANITVNCNEVPPVPTVVATDACDPAGIVNGPVWINEIHYDNTGTDAGEFIEIAGRAGTNLTGHALFLYNGNGGGTYNSLPLSGIIPNQSNGFGAIAFTFTPPDVQNGAPDGIAFVKGGVIIQFLSYEGTFTAVGGPANGLTPTDIGVSETGNELPGQSLRLSGNGATYAAFTWNGPSAAAPATPGQINQGQTFPVQPPVGLPVGFTTSTTTPPGSTCPSASIITRTWTATDACGNVATNTQVITVTDNGAPAITCPTNITVNLNINGTATVNLANVGTVTATDNCSSAGNVTLSAPPLALTCANENQTVDFIISGTDQCGNVGRCTTQVFVAPLARCTPRILIVESCVCKNNATTLENGQFSERIKIESISGLTWTITAITGLYNAASANPPAAPLNDLLGATFTEQPAGSGDYFLNGIHVDAVGYSITVRNNRGQELSVGNRCEYPNPVINDLEGPFCRFSPPVTLSGVPGDANIVSQGFTINGVAATVFNPSVLGVGNYTIEYTVNGGVPKAAGPNDPGCIQKVLKIVSVLATPTTINCNDNVQLSLDEDCRVAVLPDMVLEGDAPCYDDYEVVITGLNGQSFGNILTGANIGQKLKVTVRHLVSGNTCWGNITVEDKLPPVLICLDVWTVCAVANYDPSYLRNTLGIVEAQPTATDNCNLRSLTYIDNPIVDLACTAPKINNREVSAYFIRKWTATDASGNTATCEQFIYLERRHVWDVQFPGDVDIACDGTGNPGVPYILFNGVQLPVYPSTQSCEFSVGRTDQNIPVCDGTRKIIRTWVVLDWCLPTGSGTTPVAWNNPRYHIQVIKYADHTGPVAQCPPAQVTVSTDALKCCATVDLPDVLVEDNCSRVNNIGAMVTVRDPLNNNTVVRMESVTGFVNDFPGNNWWTPDTMAYVNKTTCLPVGEHDVRYTITDDCGNETFCNFKLNIRDFTPPIAACDEFTVGSLDGDDPFDCYLPEGNCKFAGVAYIKAFTFDDGSYDNCKGPLKFTVRRMAPYSAFVESLNKQDGIPPCDNNSGSPTEYQRATTPPDVFNAAGLPVFDPYGGGGDSLKIYCGEVGTTQTVILRIYQLDENGNYTLGPNDEPVYGECMVQIEVQDKVRPTCVPPAHVTISCENFDPSLWAYGKPTVLDNCCLDESQIYQGQCGLTHVPNYGQFDTTCNKGTIVRTFRVFDCHGNTGSCTQRVVVTYEEDYYVRFPDDRIVTVCDGTGLYGAPTFFGEDCELLATSFKDDTFTVVPDACFKIERTWKVINWCTYDPNCDLTHVPNPNPSTITNATANLTGPIVSDRCNAPTTDPWRSTRVRINPTDAQETNYCNYWQLAASCWPTGSKFNGYYYTQIIKIIDGQDPVVNCVKPDTCDLTDNDPLFWNVDYWWDATHSSHDLCEMPIDLKLTATDLCSGPNVNFRYLLFLDLDGNGTMETVVSSAQLPPTNTIYYGNALLPNYQGGAPRAFDHRLVVNPTLDWYRFAIQVTRSGANATAAVRFNTQRAPNTFVLPQIPHGKHKIKWIVEDGCGNETTCEYPFEVKDCKKPTIVCKPLSVNIMQTGTITLWASDFLEYMFDNCTPSNQLTLGIVEEVVATGIFPRDPVTRLPIVQVTFDCNDMGPQIINLWAEDSRGNADYCAVYVQVQDNMGSCTQKATVAGELKTETAQGVSEGNVSLSGSHPALPPISLFSASDDKGAYHFSNAIPMLGNYTVTPQRSDNSLNGVTTLDLALISKHVLGIETLNSPYKLIAADANKSGTVTTFDVVELRKLILGIYDELPNNNSWRFVDKGYVFPNPANPFTAAFPETKTIANIQANQMAEHFVGVKIGDVNGTALANNLMQADDRTDGVFLFDVQDRAVKAGEVFEVVFKAAELTAGYQFTLNYPGLEVMDIAPGAQMGLDHFAVFAKDNALTTSFNPDASGDAKGEFAVKFRAKQAGQLSKMLSLSSRITKAEAYGATTQTGERKSVALRFGSASGMTINGVGFELYQNQPNPFVSKTMIGFHLPEAATATLTVFDEAGKLVHRQEGAFAKGHNSFTLERELVPTTGLLYYKVETATDSATRKMTQTK